MSEEVNEKHPGGRPTEYQIEYCQKVHGMAVAGATDYEIAESLGIVTSTLYVWKHKHPEFAESLKLGKEAADARVESALYHRAIGYKHEAVKIMQNGGEVIVEPYIEHVPPDVGAAKLWLTNRKSGEWKERITHGGDPANPLVVSLDLAAATALKDAIRGGK